jgi:hypothetical protein
MKSLRIGAGAGFAGDRIDPAIDLARDGKLDYLVFECLAERTIALAQLSKRQKRSPGFDPLLRERMTAVLPHCRKHGTRIVSNMGAANPRAAAKETARIARELGLHGLRVAAVTGDDVLRKVRRRSRLENSGIQQEQLVSANAYLGADALLDALRGGADVVLTGRVADPSLFLAPMIFEFGWALDDWNLLGRGTAVGHLLECAGQLTGGYFADPGHKDVPDLDTLGFPRAEVQENGEAILTKLEGSGGELTMRTCKEQILYEVQDPARYLTPDVTADFTRVHFHEIAPDRIRISGARGTARPAELKVSTGFYEGFVAEGQISYAGPGALSRARLARDVLASRLRWIPPADLQLSFIGVNAMHGEALSEPGPEPYEVRLRAASRRLSQPQARELVQEVESLYVNGPAGGGGVSTFIRENIAMDAMFLPRGLVRPTTTYEVA